eukprot:763693-Hanusia_phi.AAC.1
MQRKVKTEGKRQEGRFRGERGGGRGGGVGLPGRGNHVLSKHSGSRYLLLTLALHRKRSAVSSDRLAPTG